MSNRIAPRPGYTMVAATALATAAPLTHLAAPNAQRWLYLASIAVLAASPWVALRWWRPTLKRTWRLVGAGLAVVFAGDLLLVAAGRDVTDTAAEGLWITEVFYVAGLTVVAGGFAYAIRRTGADHIENFVLDVTTMVVGLVAMVVPFVVTPIDDESAAAAVLLNLLHVLFHIAFLATFLRGLTVTGIRSASGLLISVGLVGWIVGGIAHLVVVGGDAPQWMGEILAPWWTVTSIVIAVGVLHPSMVDLFTSHDFEPRGRRHIVGSVLLLSGFALVLALTSGTRFEVDLRFAVVVIASLAGLVSAQVSRLLTAREQATAEIERTYRYFRALAAHSSDALLALDAHGVIRDGAPALRQLLAVDDPIGHPLWEYLGPSDATEHQEMFSRLLRTPGELFEREISVVDGTGQTKLLNLRAVNMIDDPDVGRVIINLDDITQRRAIERELDRASYLDHLTGVANRRALRRRLTERRLEPSQDSRRHVLCVVDLDGFAKVNESFGHEYGDEVLVTIAERLTAEARQDDLVARIGADEFALHLEASSATNWCVASVGNRLQRSISEPITVAGKTWAPTASIGVATTTDPAGLEAALEDASFANRQARQRGTGQVLQFDPAMRRSSAERLRHEGDLPAALERGEFELHYQPIINLDTGALAGFEALLRWNHPELGLIPPDKFIPLAEANGLIIPMGRWVVETAVACLRNWRTRYDRSLRISVNISARQLAEQELVGTIRQALEREQLRAGALTLEVTETALVDDTALAAQRLQELADLGVRIAIDDFGTGYSSLAYLRQFPVHILKIDRSFVTLIDGASGEPPPIVRGILDLAKALNLATVAEGIETDHQRRVLASQGCTLGQGYHFSRPLPYGQATSMLSGELA